MSNIEDIKDRIDIVDFISETVQLRRTGNSYMGFCPFHDNKRSPAFAVFPDSRYWRCFGQCNEGGDIFKFVMKKEGWEFAETLRFLADRAGIQLRKFTPEEETKREENARLRDLLEDAVSFFRHHLVKTKAGAPALTYLQNRGLTSETIQVWGIGYAPNGWDIAIKHFQDRGYSMHELIDAGLVTQRDDAKTYDRFRNRVTFAIRDARGRMSGFGARTLEKDGIPKYLNSPQTPVFEKSNLLYGLDQAQRQIRAEEEAVIVEGYMDVIALHQAGFKNAVSPMGTALTESQLRLLKGRARRFVLALDADAAGNTATLRGLQLARETLDRETEIGFDPRGLIRQEARLQADIRIATLPEGEDPDEVVNRDPDEWRQIIRQASPVVAHVMQILAEGEDLDDPKAKTKIADQVLPLINDIPSAIERDTYIQRLSRLLKVDERTLLYEQQKKRTAPKPRRYPKKPQDPVQVSRSTDLGPHKADVQIGIHGVNREALEVFSLGVLMRNPALIFRVDRALKKAGLNQLSSNEFLDTGHQNLMKCIREAVEQDFDVPDQVLLGSLPLALHEQADAILEKVQDLPENIERLLEDLMRAILDMRRKTVQQSISQLRFLMEDAQENGDILAADFQQTMMQHTAMLVRLDKAVKQTHDRTILNN